MIKIISNPRDKDEKQQKFDVLLASWLYGTEAINPLLAYQDLRSADFSVADLYTLAKDIKKVVKANNRRNPTDLLHMVKIAITIVEESVKFTPADKAVNAIIEELKIAGDLQGQSITLLYKLSGKQLLTLGKIAHNYVKQLTPYLQEASATLLQNHAQSNQTHLSKESLNQILAYITLGTKLTNEALTGLSGIQLEQLSQNLPKGKAGDSARQCIRDFCDTIAKQRTSEIVHDSSFPLQDRLAMQWIKFESAKNHVTSGFKISPQLLADYALSTQQLLELYTRIQPGLWGDESRKNIAASLSSMLTFAELEQANFTIPQLKNLYNNLLQDPSTDKEILGLAILQKQEFNKVKPSDKAIAAVYLEAKYTSNLGKNAHIIIERLNAYQLKELGKSANELPNANVIKEALRECMLTLYQQAPSQDKTDKLMALETVGIKISFEQMHKAFAPKNIDLIYARPSDENGYVTPVTSTKSGILSDIISASESPSFKSLQTMHLKAPKVEKTQNKIAVSGWNNSFKTVLNKIGAIFSLGSKPIAASTPSNKYKQDMHCK